MSDGQSKYQILLTASDQTREAFESAKNNTTSLSDKLEVTRLAFAATAIASATAIAVMVKGSIDAADSMSKAAQKVGTTTEMLSGLKYAADMSDVSFESLQKSLGKLSSAAYTAATTGGEAAGAFKTLGINVKGTDGHLKDSGTLLEELAGKFAAMPDSAEKSAMAIKLFGKSGMEMIPLLNSGSEGLSQMREEAAKLGIIIGSDTAKSAEEFNDNLTRITKRTEGLSNQIMTDLMPALNELTDAYMKATDSSSAFSGVSAVVKTIFETVAVVGVNAAYVFHSVGAEIGGMAAQLAALSTGDFEGVSRIGKMMKEDAEAARKEVDALSERILNPPKREQTEDKPRGALPGLDTERADKDLDDLLKKSQQFSAELVISHQSAFDKIVTKYVEMDEKLTQTGSAGTEARKQLQANFELFVNEEADKRTEKIRLDQEKEDIANNKLIEAQQEKFNRIREMAEESALLGEEKEIIRREAKLAEIEKDKLDLEARHIWNQQLEMKYAAAKEQIVSSSAIRITAINKTEQAKRERDNLAASQAIISMSSQVAAAAMGFLDATGQKNSDVGKLIFAASKALAVAQAIVNTEVAATAALAYGGPAGPALASWVRGLGYVSVGLIAATALVGGGGSSGGGGSMPTAQPGADLTSPPRPAAPEVPQNPYAEGAPIPVESQAAQATRTVNISMSGEAQLYTAQSIRELLIPALNEAAGDGVTINVVPA